MKGQFWPGMVTWYLHKQFSCNASKQGRKPLLLILNSKIIIHRLPLTPVSLLLHFSPRYHNYSHGVIKSYHTLKSSLQVQNIPANDSPWCACQLNEKWGGLFLRITLYHWPFLHRSSAQSVLTFSSDSTN